jgi:hypothetical protein
MVDPTSDLGEDDPESAPRCECCGEPALGAERRTVTRIEDGIVEHRHFCDPACREEWEE